MFLAMLLSGAASLWASCTHTVDAGQRDKEETATLLALHNLLANQARSSPLDREGLLTKVKVRSKNLADSYLDCIVGAKDEDAQYFHTRQQLYDELSNDLLTNTVADGYHPTDKVGKDFLDDAEKPSIKTLDQFTLAATGKTTRVIVRGQRPGLGFVDSVALLACRIFGTATEADCIQLKQAGSANKAAEKLLAPGTAAPSLSGGYSGEDYVAAAPSGETEMFLKNPFTGEETGEFLTIVQVITAIPSTTPASGPWVKVSTPYPAPEKESEAAKFYTPCSRAIGLDCSFVAGVEISSLVSKPSTTQPFVRLYLRDHPMLWNTNVWGTVRIVGAPSPTSTSGVTAAIADATGTIKTDTFSNVGTAVDFEFGLEHLRNYTFPGIKNWQVARGIYGGYGATSPLQADSLQAAYTVPSAGTVECNTLLSKFGGVLSQAPYNIASGSTLDSAGKPLYPTSSPACLVNTNASSKDATGAVTYTPVTTLGFSSRDRTNFLSKYLFGYRFVLNRNQEEKACGPTAATTAPCSIGMLDASVGGDASITGGGLNLKRWIFKVDAVMPIPITKGSWFYAFGSFSARIAPNSFESTRAENVPLILQAANIASLTGAAAVPNTSTVVLPLKQPDRDFYRIGFGLDVICLFSQFSGASSSCGK